MGMTLRERLLTTLRGGIPDRIPWNIYAWLLPESEAGRRMHERGLSLLGSSRIFREINEDVSIVHEQVDVRGETRSRVRIETPAGALTQESTVEAGYGSHWIRKYFITGPDDYAAAEFLFRHTRFEPDYDPWYAANDRMRDGGIVIGEIMPIPILYLMVSWMGIEGLTEGIYFHTERFDALIDALDVHYDRQVQLAAECPAEVIWFPDNVTASVISPKWFERYCAPVYNRAMPVMRAAHKIPIAHYDGSIRPLLGHLARTDLPVIEAFTPPPMGDVRVSEAQAAWPDKVVSVNFPGNMFLASPAQIEAYTLELLEEAVPGGRLVIGCTEDFPIPEFDKTFSAIGRAMAQFEGVAWG